MSPKLSSSKGFLSALTTSIGVGGGSSATSAISALSTNSAATSGGSSWGNDRKAHLKEKRRRQKDAERVEKLRLLVSYLKSGSTQQNPIELEPDDLELAHDRWCWPPDLPSSNQELHLITSPASSVSQGCQSSSQTNLNNCCDLIEHTLTNANINNNINGSSSSHPHCGKLFYICDDDDMILSSGDTAASTTAALPNNHHNHHHHHHERKQSDGGGSCDIHSCQLSSIGTAASCCFQDMMMITPSINHHDSNNNTSQIKMNSNNNNDDVEVEDMTALPRNTNNHLSSSGGFILDHDHHHHDNHLNHLFICHNNHHHNEDGLLTSISANNIRTNMVNKNNCNTINNDNNISNHDCCGGSTTSASSNVSTTGSGSGCAGSNVSCVSENMMNDYIIVDRCSRNINHNQTNNVNNCNNGLMINNKHCISDQTLKTSTTSWSHPQNLAAWIDNEVNSLVNDLEEKSQLLCKEKHSKKTIFTLANKCRYKWLSSACRKTTSSSHST